MIPLLKITKGHNSVTSIDEVALLYLCISSGYALYLYQISAEYLESFESY